MAKYIIRVASEIDTSGRLCVEADFFTIEDGHLILCKGDGEYSVGVLCIPAGEWFLLQRHLEVSTNGKKGGLYERERCVESLLPSVES